MYIIDKLTREILPWNEVMEELNEIGGGADPPRGGFDYGVRPWDMWGQKMPASIFEWKSMLKEINEVIKPKNTPKGYADVYKIKDH